MSDRDENLREYLVLLRRFGLSKGELARLHWTGSSDPPDVSPGRLVAHEIDDDARTVDALHSRCRRVLAESTTGIDLPAGASASQFETALQGAFDAYDVTFELDPIAAPDLDGVEEGDPVEVTLADRHGNERTTTDAFPAPDAMPELIGVVERELLDDVEVTFVQLDSPEDRVRLFLLSEPRLEALRDTYDDRIAFGDRPVLAERHPTDFASTPAAEAGGAGDGDDAETDDAVAASGQADEGETPAESWEGVPEDDVAADAAEGGVDWLGDDDVDLGDVGFEPATAEPEPAESTDEGPDDVDAVDFERAFDEIESGSADMDWGASLPDERTESGVGDVAPGDTASETGTQNETESVDRTEGDDSIPSIRPGSDPTPALRPIRVTPNEDPVPATTKAPRVDPSGTTSPATKGIEVSPGDEPTPAVERRADRPAVEPATSPGPAIDRVEVTPDDSPEPIVERLATTPGTDTRPAVEAVAVTPQTDVTPAVRSRSATPAVTPGDSLRPAVSRIAVSPESTTVPAASGIGVTPVDDPRPAIREREASPEVGPSDDPRPAVRRASPTPDGERETETATDAEDAAASETAKSEPAVTPGESPTSAVHRIEVTPGDDPSEAVLWAPFVYSPRTPPGSGETDEDEEAEAEADDEKGVVERVTGWLGDRL